MQEVWDRESAAQGNLIVPAAHFLDVREGMPRTAVETLCGGPGQHRFSLRESRHDFSLVTYTVRTTDDCDWTGYVLFQDGVLFKVLDADRIYAVPDPLTTRPADSPEPFADTLERARGTVTRCDGLTYAQIRESIDENAVRERARRAQGSNLGPLVPFLLLSGYLDAGAVTAKTSEVCSRVNASKIDLGMTELEVERQLGKPCASGRLSDGTLQIYLAEAEIKSSWYVASIVKVVFEAGRASVILSYHELGGSSFRSWLCGSKS